MKYVYLFFLGLLLCGCNRQSSSGTPPTWRTDHKPIASRFPIVDGITALTWKGELAGQSTRTFAPGPSAYRVRCFAEEFSTAISNTVCLSDLQPTILPVDVVFPEHLKSVSASDWFTSQTIDNALFTLKYQGKAFYAPTHDLLYFDSFWQ